MNSVTYTFAAFTWADHHSVDESIKLMSDDLSELQIETLRAQMNDDASGTEEVAGWSLTWAPLIPKQRASTGQSHDD